MNLRRLSGEEFQATVNEPMTDVSRIPEAAIDLDIWPYAEAAMLQEFPDRDTARWDVKQVYADAENDYQHVFIRTDRRKLFLIIVLDIEKKAIHGHFVLDMKAEYG